MPGRKCSKGVVKPPAAMCGVAIPGIFATPLTIGTVALSVGNGGLVVRWTETARQKVAAVRRGHDAAERID